jgi:hypothetical protein
LAEIGILKTRELETIKKKEAVAFAGSINTKPKTELRFFSTDDKENVSAPQARDAQK